MSSLVRPRAATRSRIRRPGARNRSRGGAWRGVAAAILIALPLAWPRAAWAHAHLRRSDPAAGARVATPAVIRFWFSEAPELVETRVTLTDGAGHAVPLGPVEHDPDGSLALRVRVPATLGAGAYRVRWRTAAADGHPSSGGFTFTVVAAAAEQSSATPATGRLVPAAPLAPAVPRAPAPVLRDTAPLGTTTPDTGADALTPAYVAARALSFAALLAVIGAVVFRVAVVGRATALAPDVRDAMASRAAGVAAAAALLLLVGAGARLLLQTQMMHGSAALDAAHLRMMTMETHWGTAWVAQTAAALVALAGFALVRRRVDAGWFVAGASCLVLAVSPGLGGHAAASPRFAALALTGDALHVLGASGWLGSLLLVALVGLPVAFDGRATTLGEAPGADPWATVGSLVHAFSPVAVACAAMVALTGVASAWLRLGSVPALWTSGYGRVLLVKLALLAGVAAAGAHNWRRVRPALGTEAATARLRRSVTLELGIGLLVIIATAVLVATPAPADLG